MTPPGAYTLLGLPMGELSGQLVDLVDILGLAGRRLGEQLLPPATATLEPDQFQSTLQLSVSFLRPVRPGRVIGKGRIVHRNGELVFLEAALIDANGAVIATAAATRAGDRTQPRPGRGVTVAVRHVSG